MKTIQEKTLHSITTPPDEYLAFDSALDGALATLKSKRLNKLEKTLYSSVQVN